MTDSRRAARIVELIGLVLRHQGLAETEVTPDSELYDEGIGLDSMCVAELSALLEKEYGHEPYTSGLMPGTVADIIGFYED
jgi:acyl carrier protein